MTNATPTRAARKTAKPRAATAPTATTPAKRTPRTVAVPVDEPVAAEPTSGMPTVPVEILDRTITVTVPSPDQLVAYRRIGARLANSTETDPAVSMDQIDDALDMIGGLMSSADMRWIEQEMAAGNLTIEGLVTEVFAGITEGVKALADARSLANDPAPSSRPRPRARRR